MIISQIALYLYEIQHNVNAYLIEQINNLTVFSFLAIFVCGLLTSFSPCMASSIPVVVSYVNTQKKTEITKWILIFGILTSILSVGVIAIIIKKNILNQLHYLSYITTILFILIGLNLLEINFINLPRFQSFLPKLRNLNSLKLTYLLGISIGLNISPCSTPILTILIIWITNTNNIAIGISLLLIYSIGYLSPIIGCFVSIPLFNTIKITSEIWYLLEIITGGLLISTGIFSICNKVIYLTLF